MYIMNNRTIAVVKILFGDIQLRRWFRNDLS